MITGPYKGEKSLEAWLDRHHVDIIRTHATTPDGAGVGKYCNRPKFIKTLPEGHGLADVALAMDLAGSPHLSAWHSFRSTVLGDIALRPDIETLISDGTDPNLGHVICDFTQIDGSPIDLCPRTKLKRLIGEVAALGYDITATFELEFFLFDNSFADVRRKQYKNLNPVGASQLETIYLLRNAYHSKPFMDEVTQRLDWYGIAWEGWNDENGTGQLELNLTPTDPLTMTDNVIRAKQVIYEVAVDLDMAATFMAHPGHGYSSGMHIHHSLTSGDKPVFYDESAPGHRSELMKQWMAGIVKTMPGAVSYLCPTINAFRRIRDFAAPPVTATWGNENKSAALRTVSHSPGATRIEHRLGGADMNPYLAMAVILAGGLAGVRHKLELEDEFTGVGWGLPASFPRLPNTITRAADALDQDPYLKEILGEEDVNYWAGTRRIEWLAFHTEGGDPMSRTATPWEYERYFEVV